MTTVHIRSSYNVEKRMKRWAGKNRWKRFLRSGSIDDDLATCTVEINGMVEKLQASLRKMQSLQWLMNEPFPVTFSCSSSEGHERNRGAYANYRRFHYQ